MTMLKVVVANAGPVTTNVIVNAGPVTTNVIVNAGPVTTNVIAFSIFHFLFVII